MKQAPLRSVDSSDAEPAEAVEPEHGGGGYWGLVRWYAGFLIRVAALLAVVCATYGLWLGIAAAWGWMGL